MKEIVRTDNRIYYASSDGKIQYYLLSTGKYRTLKGHVYRGDLRVFVDGRTYVVKSLISKLFTEGYQKNDRIINKNGDATDCSINNLLNISKEVRNKNKEVKGLVGRNYYTMDDIAYELGISTSTVQEIKKKLWIQNKVFDEELKKIKRFTDDVKKEQGKVTLYTINRFLIDHKLEDYR